MKRSTFSSTLLLSFLICSSTSCDVSNSPSESEPTRETTQQTQFVKNTLRWNTASEQDLFGFYIFRGDSQEGPFAQLNKLPLPGAGTTDEQQSYEFVDEKAVPGEKYFYYLETLMYDNRRKRFSPVFEFQTPTVSDSQ